MHDRSQEFFVMDAPNAHFKAKMFIPKIRFVMGEVTLQQAVTLWAMLTTYVHVHYVYMYM